MYIFILYRYMYFQQLTLIFHKHKISSKDSMWAETCWEKYGFSLTQSLLFCRVNLYIYIYIYICIYI